MRNILYLCTQMTSREYLQQHGIMPTDERLKVVDCLMAHHTHPTGDEVYNCMRSNGYSISRATVFNTLKLLSDRSAVNTLLIEDGVTRYDIVLSPHAHFRCSRCGRIFDVPLRRRASFDLPQGFSESRTDYFISGLCPDCLNDK